MKLFSVFLILYILNENVDSYKFLAILPIPSRSHYYIGQNLMKGLAEDGHEVTVISPFKEKTPIKNYKEVFLEHNWVETQKYMAKDNFMDFANLFFWDMTFAWYEAGMNFTKWTVSSRNLQDFLKIKQHFDVVVVETNLNDALLGLGMHYNAPIVAISAFGANKWTTDLVGTPIFASYVPFTLNHFTDRMTFWQRMYNSLSFWFEDIVHPVYFIPNQQKQMEHLFPKAKNWPSLEEIRRNVSLVLLNTHVTLGTPRPYAPNMIEVGGMQIQKEIEPLALRIQTFLDEAKDGAIFVSLGSNVLINKLPEQKLNAITNAFKAYPNYRILIKSDEHIVITSHKEADVLVESWFNQQSILAHKNIKLFVTHGGLLSTTEAVHFGKPLVGIPFFFDQYLNMYLAQQRGYAQSVPIQSLTADKITTAVDKVLSNPSYAEQAKLISDRFRDQPLTPLETGKFWVKHVAKNKGAPHLRSVAVELPFYKLYNLDVWAFICGVIAFCVFLLTKLIRALVFVLFGAKSTHKVKQS
ncbi:UDP-glucosyltransferase 2-like [Sitodiplosis mosellana]|uniref:UDP-glucosyltransferase 2-like n=1 Tax=Sitodiplosis mosellana TaxID=263140 RepID=UPI002444C434|nr:UDP-glucosyltransferase 2-like [Sitodiplosis mosellana]XP_055326067.1 UDP-glucosyltransferase 2-like [Sitodiplosis mosellana]